MRSDTLKVRTFKPTCFEDFRGEIYTTWSKEPHKGAFYPKLNFCHDKFSRSRKHVLRGFHGDERTWKLISCVYGDIFLAVVDNCPHSDTYLQVETFTISDRNKLQVLVPPGFGNAHLVMSDEAVFHYKLAYDGEYSDVDLQFVIKWNDPRLKVEWPINNPILYGRDR
tara:strand:+ start:12472 stop:12972 length:501 start_codon:yes stop_codon:yes gene_type:complete